MFVLCDHPSALPHLKPSSERMRASRHSFLETMRSFFMVQPWRTKPAEKVGNGIPTVAKQFRPLVFLLSAFSPYGIGVNKSSDEKKEEITYDARKLSWKRPFLPIYSLGILCWMVFCVCIQAFNIALDVPFPIDLVTLRSPGNTSGEVTLSLSTNRLILGTIAFCRLLEFMGLFFSAPLLAKWLNELTAIQLDFNTCFGRLGGRQNVNITSLRNHLAAFYLVGPGVFWMAAYSWAFLPQHQFNWKYTALGNIWFVSIAFYILVSELLEDVKMLLMFETIRRIYSQIRVGVRQEVNFEEIKEANVVAWDALITKLRRHVKLTGECLKTQLILNVCETVFLLSFGTYMIIRSAGGYSKVANMGFAITAGFHCLFMAARLYVKVAIAESIYTEERLLIEDLKDSEVRVRATPSDALHELRNLQQSLRLDPARIEIGSFCDLDGKLLVQVVIQTVPILVAVAQFHASV